MDATSHTGSQAEDEPTEVIGELTPEEETWVARYEFLKDHGYMLRPRYRPGWQPHWPSTFGYFSSEDGIIQTRGNVLDGVSLKTGNQVFLKCVSEIDHDVEVHQYLERLPEDSRNHCTPYLDILRLPDEPGKCVMVLPLLRRVNHPPIASAREAVDFVQQTLEGLIFLHEHKVAHRDCNWPNIMMEGTKLYPSGWHPEIDRLYPDGSSMGNYTPSRTAVGGVKYYFVDFGISSVGKDLVTGLAGQVRAPELSDDTPYNPYSLDVYVLGKAYDGILIDGVVGTEFLISLVDYMTKPVPSERPTASEALSQFQEIRQMLTEAQLGQRLHSSSESTSTSRWLGDIYYRFLEVWWFFWAGRQ